MGLLEIDLAEGARAAVEGMLNGVGQGFLFAAAVAIVVRSIRSVGASMRHLIWLTALAAVAALTVLAASDRLSEAAAAGARDPPLA